MISWDTNVWAPITDYTYLYIFEFYLLKGLVWFGQVSCLDSSTFREEKIEMIRHGTFKGQQNLLCG